MTLGTPPADTHARTPADGALLDDINAGAGRRMLVRVGRPDRSPTSVVLCHRG
jgi:hypothetical protein